MNETKKNAKSERGVTTLIGRRRILNNFASNNKELVAQNERQV